MPDPVAQLTVVIDHGLILHDSAGFVARPPRLLVRHGQHDGIVERGEFPGTGTVLGRGGVADVEKGTEIVEGRVEAHEELVDGVHLVLWEDAAYILEVRQQANELVGVGFNAVEGGAWVTKGFKLAEDALEGCREWFFENVLEGLEHGRGVGQILQE